MKQKHQFDLTPFEINKKQKISLKDFDPNYTDQLKGKKHSEKTLAEDIKDLAESGGTSVRLSDEIKKAGGKLTMEQMMKLAGQ